jgi:hypothetical protein
MVRGCAPEGVCAQPIRIDGGIISLVTLVLVGGHAAQIGKRWTEWRPEEKARAKRIENGDEPCFGNGK